MTIYSSSLARSLAHVSALVWVNVSPGLKILMMDILSCSGCSPTYALTSLKDVKATKLFRNHQAVVKITSASEHFSVRTWGLYTREVGTYKQSRTVASPPLLLLLWGIFARVYPPAWIIFMIWYLINLTEQTRCRRALLSTELFTGRATFSNKVGKCGSFGRRVTLFCAVMDSSTFAANWIKMGNRLELCL